MIQHPSSEAGPINELPWFTFLFADLHAHLMTLPYTVLVLGLALAWLRPSPERPPRLSRLPARSAAVDSPRRPLWPLNTWDYPTYALLVLVAFLLRAGAKRASARSPHSPALPHRLARAVGTWFALLAAG